MSFRVSPVPSEADPERLGALRSTLLEHYDREHRTLPWRGETDPYRVLVSEVMLQQTRVETVLGYYGRWLERFPDVDALAEAPEDEVLKAWEGLGYYRRARNLHGMARMVRERADGRLPATYQGLRELPGVGEYTAGAVASIAFGVRAPAVDGNVRRVLSRWFDRPAPKAAWLREVATRLVDPERPGDWNQALMELGATVCSPRAPLCERCPVVWGCAARAAGTELERPGSGGRAAVREATFAVAVLLAERRVLLVRRPSEGLLGGMWAFPETELAADAGGTAHRDGVRAAGVVAAIAEALGVTQREAPTPLPTVTHRFSHIKATYLPFAIVVSARARVPGGRWVEVGVPHDLALPRAQQKILESMNHRIITEAR